MIVGGWTRKLRPLPGELLTSCLARNAQAHGSTPYRFLALFWPRDPVWDRDFDRDPADLRRVDRRPRAPDWLDDISRHLAIPRHIVDDATLAGYRRCLGGSSLAAQGDSPLILSAGVHHRTRTRHALQFCPDCLVEGIPHYRKIWRLGFVVACVRHGRGLLDGCNQCGAPVAPHRSMTTRLTDCHRCGRAIAGGKAKSVPALPDAAVALQDSLVAALDGSKDLVPTFWQDRSAFDVVRSLLAISAAPPVHVLLRQELGLGNLSAGATGRLRFEQTRLEVRIPWLETVATWASDWPRSFRNGAEAAGLSQRTFLRRRLPPPLAAEVSRLPLGTARDRTWVPVLDEPVLRRLRRTDRAAYSRVRAARILEACGGAE